MLKRITICLVILLTVGVLNAVVKNEGKPVKGEWDFDLQEAWSVYNAGGNPLAKIQSIQADQNGNVFMVDRKFEKFIAFDSKGKEMLCFGKKGEGPGEVLRFGDFFLKGDYIIVDDRGNRFHYFTKNGEYKNTIRYGHTLIPKVFIDDSRFVAIRSNLESNSKNEYETLELCDVHTTKKHTIAFLEPEELAEATDNSGTKKRRISVEIPGLSPSIVVGTDGKSLFFGKNDEYLIKKTDLTGKELLSFSLTDRKPTPVSKEFKKGLFKRSNLLPPQVIKELIDALPNRCTFFSDIYVDETGLIYVCVTNITNKSIQEIDIFSPTGKYLYHSRIILPGNAKAVASPEFAGNFLFIYVEDEEEELKLVKYKITKPTSS